MKIRKLFGILFALLLMAGLLSAGQTVFAAETYTIEVKHAHEDRGTVTGGGSYTEGTTVTITATPNTGYHFGWWTDKYGCIVPNAGATYTFPAKGNAAYYAWFCTYSVTVTTDGNGTASSRQRAGDTGSTIELTYEPNDGYMFKEWQVISGGVTVENNQFDMETANVVIKAVFEKIPETVYKVTVTSKGNGTASAYPASGTASTEVLLTAYPDEGYRLKAWEVISGGVTISNNKFTLGKADAEIRAVFEEIPKTCTISVSCAGDSGGTVSGSGEYKKGASVTIKAVPAAGYRFDYWTNQYGEKISGAGSVYTFTASQTIGYTAWFSCMIGDVNLDNKVDATDRMILARYLAGWEGYEAKITNKKAADIDGDGDITAKDRMLLARYLAGWTGYDTYFK